MLGSTNDPQKPVSPIEAQLGSGNKDNVWAYLVHGWDQQPLPNQSINANKAYTAIETVGALIRIDKSHERFARLKHLMGPRPVPAGPQYESLKHLGYSFGIRTQCDGLSSSINVRCTIIHRDLSPRSRNRLKYSHSPPTPRPGLRNFVAVRSAAGFRRDTCEVLMDGDEDH